MPTRPRRYSTSRRALSRRFGAGVGIGGYAGRVLPGIAALGSAFTPMPPAENPPAISSPVLGNAVMGDRPAGILPLDTAPEALLPPLAPAAPPTSATVPPVGDQSTTIATPPAEPLVAPDPAQIPEAPAAPIAPSGGAELIPGSMDLTPPREIPDPVPTTAPVEASTLKTPGGGLAYPADTTPTPTSPPFDVRPPGEGFTTEGRLPIPGVVPPSGSAFDLGAAAANALAAIAPSTGGGGAAPTADGGAYLSYDEGGVIDEPVIGKGMRTGRIIVLAGNGRPERVTPMR